MKLNGNENGNKENKKSKEQKTFTDLQEQVLKFEETTGKVFAEFFSNYYPKLVYYITKICKDEDLAEDLAIESFVSSLEKIENYEKDKAQYSTWLFTIARNATLQAIKDNNKFVSMDSKIDDEGTSIKDFISDKGDEEIKLNESSEISNAKAKITIDSIQKLKQPYRKVVEMRELERMSYKDIATELGNDVFFEITVSKKSKIKLPKELSYATDIIDAIDGKEVQDFKLIEGDSKKTPFFTHIEIPVGTYIISGREPHNLSTLKSQIRNGRILLEKMVKKDFKRIIDIYGDY
jgi:RNA polymerase sigma factor (sigma-70 family)